MNDGCSEPDVELDAARFSNARQLRRNGCFCYRATLDELLADDLMEPVLRTAGYEPDEFREMMTEMARYRVTLRGRYRSRKAITSAAWNARLDVTGLLACEGDEDVCTAEDRRQS
jgi:hypothetical protein